MRFRTATFATLRESASSRCDACGERVDPNEAEGIAGKGTYLWVRGGEVRREEVPLCARCGAAVGLTVLSRLAIEEEEG